MTRDATTTIREVWAARLGVPVAALETSGVTLVERPTLTAAVVVELGAAVVVAAPPHAVATVRDLDRAAVVDVSVLAAALGGVPLGAAWLATADVVQGPLVAPTSDLIALTVMAACGPGEQDESGLKDMPLRFVVLDDGQPVALAGYEIWDDALAHLGVLVAPTHRGRGLAAHAAGAAARHAIAAGLVPQWRSSVDNPASTAVADRLGFVRLGRQLAVDLDRP